LLSLKVKPVAGKSVSTLRLVVPSHQIDVKKEIELAENLHIAISVTEENKLEWKLSEAPFMYM